MTMEVLELVACASGPRLKIARRLHLFRIQRAAFIANLVLDLRTRGHQLRRSQGLARNRMRNLMQ